MEDAKLYIAAEGLIIILLSFFSLLNFFGGNSLNY